MRPLSLDFIGRRRSRSRRLIIMSLLSGLSALAVSLALSYKQSAKEVNALADELRKRDDTSRQVKPPPLTLQQLEVEQASSKEAMAVVGKLSTPWDALFRIFESIVDEDTVLLALDPQPVNGEIQVTAESRNFPAMLAYVKRLRESPSLRDVYVSSHEVQQQDPQHPVRFVINARWDTTVTAENASKRR